MTYWGMGISAGDEAGIAWDSLVSGQLSYRQKEKLRRSLLAYRRICSRWSDCGNILTKRPNQQADVNNHLLDDFRVRDLMNAWAGAIGVRFALGHGNMLVGLAA